MADAGVELMLALVVVVVLLLPLLRAWGASVAEEGSDDFSPSICEIQLISLDEITLWESL